MAAKHINDLLDSIRETADLLAADDLEELERTNGYYLASGLIKAVKELFSLVYTQEESVSLPDRTARLRDALAGLAELRSPGCQEYDQIHAIALDEISQLRMDVKLIERQWE